MLKQADKVTAHKLPFLFFKSVVLVQDGAHLVVVPADDVANSQESVVALVEKSSIVEAVQELEDNRCHVKGNLASTRYFSFGELEELCVGEIVEEHAQVTNGVDEECHGGEARLHRHLGTDRDI